MRNRWERCLIYLIVLISILFATGVYGLMPETMVTHWGLYGEPNGWMSRFWGVMIFPLINLFMLAIYFFVPKFEPKKENLAEFRGEYDKLMLWIFGVLNYIFVLSYLYNLGIVFDMGRMIMPGLGILFIAIGRVLPRTKQNYMVGIRTPWTLSSEEVWKKTHVFGGKIFVASGVVTLLAILLPSVWGFIVTIGSVMLSTLIVMVYSWREYQKRLKK